MSESAASRSGEGARSGAAPQEVMTSVNQTNYTDPSLVREYITQTLKPAEVMMFMKYRDAIAGRRVLEIGSGGGRVSVYLARWAAQFVGIDFSPVMIELSTRRFPGISFLLCDARDLSRFKDASFDVVVFTFNGIDTLSHEARLAALAGIRRVVAPNGLYIFSSHNRRYRNARMGPRLDLSRNPVTALANVVRFARSWSNHRTRKRMEREEKEYSLINDNAHSYTMLHYYIGRDEQRRQLESTGWDLLEVYGEDGMVLTANHDDSASGELYYVARRT